MDCLRLFMFVLALAFQIAGAVLLILKYWGNTKQRIINEYYPGAGIANNDGEDNAILDVSRVRECVIEIYSSRAAFIYIAVGYALSVFGEKGTAASTTVLFMVFLVSGMLIGKDLLNWYTSPMDEKEINEAILACQRENVFWDIGLRKRFMKGSIIVIVLFCVAVFIMGITKNESIIRLLWRLAFIAPMVKWLLSTIRQISLDIDDLNELDNRINGSEMKTMEELQDIQKQIFDHRTKCYVIPDFFYKLYKDEDEDRMYRVASMNRE